MDETEDRPTARQVLHAATGDRGAEARAVADRDPAVDDEDATAAVRGAHGDIAGGPDPDDDLARVDDARADTRDRGHPA